MADTVEHHHVQRADALVAAITAALERPVTDAGRATAAAKLTELDAMGDERAMDAYQMMEDSDFDADERVALFSLLDSKQRAALKRIADAERANKAGKISPAQKKRLEARIKEIGLDAACEAFVQSQAWGQACTEFEHAARLQPARALRGA